MGPSTPEESEYGQSPSSSYPPQSHSPPTTVEQFETDQDTAFSVLSTSETRWRDKQPFLESKGYMLRQRYHPGWVPSWKNSGRSSDQCEDGIILPRDQEDFIDATRVSDRKTVCIKRVRTGDNEHNTAIKLFGEDFSQDHRNHAVPILDHFPDDKDPATSYIVMPFLHPARTFRFTTRWDVIVFCDHILEGIAFFHEKSIAHRACLYRNLMIDPSKLYPKGIHPVKSTMALDGVTPVSLPPQNPAFNAKFYFTGLSKALSTSSNENPEGSSDPFKLDISMIGNILKNEFLEKYSNVQFLKPLVRRMTHEDPKRRPDAAGVLRSWRSIEKNLNREQPLKTRGSSRTPLLSSIASFFSSIVRFPKKLFSSRGRKPPIENAHS